jgi:hypothetical protein
VFRTKTIKIDEHSACSVRYALKKQLEDAKQTLQILRLAKNRELDRNERNLLPDTLKDAEREILIENINPWITLQMEYDYLIKEFTFDGD